MSVRIGAVFLAYWLAVAANQARACELEAGTRAVVTKAVSADSLLLQGGETVVLAGALAPQSGPLNDDSWPPRETTRAELERLAGGKMVEIVAAGRRLDRYGRVMAQVFIAGDTEGGTERQWVQGELIAAGLSRAYALASGAECLEEMLALETAARGDRRGHWGSGVFEDRDGSDERGLRRLSDTFQSVEGVVERVETMRGQPVLVFAGGGESGGFRAAMAVSKEGRRSSSSRRTIEGLMGARVRVRGWIEPRQRPLVLLADPRLIEVIAAAGVETGAEIGAPVPPAPALPEPMPASTPQ